MLRGGDFILAGFGSEIVFGLDNFQQQKVLSSKDSIVQVLLNLFFLRPGNIPSLPWIGINIRSYLYKFEEQIDAEELKEKIYNQCNALVPYLNLGEVKAFVASYNEKSVLIIVIPIIIDGVTTDVLFGFGKNSAGETLFNYQFDNTAN